MAIIYLLARQIKEQLDVWPCMIPVLNSENNYRFTKKGQSRDIELSNLFYFTMKNLEADDWSKEMGQKFDSYELNKQLLCVFAEQLHEDLDAIIRKQYELNMVINGEEQEERASLMDLNTLVLEREECELPL